MSRLVKIVMCVLGAVVVLSGGTAAGVMMAAHHYETKVHRDDVLGEANALPKINAPREYVVVNTPTTAPSATATATETPAPGAGENLLILGVDTRAGWTQGQSRSDTIMLVHLNAAHTEASVVSFPRDSFVYIPPVAGKWAGGKTKINAAYAWGGAPLVVQVLTYLTGVRIDHVIRVDFSAVRHLTDIVGGVDVTVRKAVTDGRTGYHFPAGVNHLDGKHAEIYVRQRYGLPRGDFDRVKRQQQYLHALAAKVVSMGVLTNPVRLNALLSAASSALVVDESLDLTATVRDISGLNPGDLTFATIPSTGYVHIPAGTANRLDKAGCQVLFAALRDDTMGDWFAAHHSYGAVTGA